jgi:hypothetical protein
VTLLGGVLTLHDPSCRGRCVKGCIRDVEELCGEALERRGITLGHSDYEDKLAFAIGRVLDPRREVRPGTGRTRKNMAAFIFFRLGQRLVDVERAEYRTVWRFKDYVYERPHPEFISYEPTSAREGKRSG